MKHRVRLSKKVSRKIFRSGAVRVHKLNVLPPIQRGGICL